MEQHYHREIKEIYRKVAKLGGLVAQGVGKALACLKEGREDLGLEVKAGDRAIDLLEVEIEEDCLKVLALYQPVARDLRSIVTLLKVTTILERMGDLAENIVNKAPLVPPSFLSESRMDIHRMGDLALEMLHMSVSALIENDVVKAGLVLDLEKEMDDLHRHHHKVVAEDIDSQVVKFSRAELGLLSISRYLERIADQSVHIAEDTIYLVEARIIRHNTEI